MLVPSTEDSQVLDATPVSEQAKANNHRGMSMSIINLKVKATAVALAGSLTAAFLGAQPASATNMNGVCEAGEFCAYYLTNFNGAIADMEFNEANFQGKTFANSSISRNDNIRSGKDRGRVYTPCLYTASNYSGSVVNTGQTVNEWSTFGSLNDTASSLRWTAGLWCA